LLINFISNNLRYIENWQCAARIALKWNGRRF
jgi:hypothetical protein